MKGELGRGAMAKIEKAVRTSDGKIVALKTPAEGMPDRLPLEAAALAEAMLAGQA